MPITVNYDPAAGAVAPSAFEAGAGMYRQRQQEIARDQGNRDRAMQFQAQQAYLDRAFAERQANRQQQQLAQQNAYRQQAQQQELLGNAMQQQMSLAAQAQQMQMRNAAYQQQSALQQQELTQKGLKDGSLRYSTAQKNQMSQLYSDWDKVNQAKNLSARDRQLAQQDLQRQFQQIQPRPVLEDERPRSLAEMWQEEALPVEGFPGVSKARDPKTGKWYYLHADRGKGGGNAQPDPNAPKEWFLPGDGSGKPYKVLGPDGKTWEDNPLHPSNAKAAPRGGSGSGGDGDQSRPTLTMPNAIKMIQDQAEAGGYTLTPSEILQDAQALIQEGQSQSGITSTPLDELLGTQPSGPLAALLEGNPQQPQQTHSTRKAEEIIAIRRQYDDMRAALERQNFNINGQKVSGADLLPDSEGLSADEMRRNLQAIGIQPQQPQPPQAAPQQQPVPMPTYQGEGNAVPMPTYQGEGNAVPMPTVPSMSSGPVLPENAILGQQLGVSDAVPYSPQWQQLPEEDRGLRSYTANKTMIQQLTDDYRTKMSGEPTVKKVIEHYQSGHSVVPIAVAQMGANYIEDKYGQAFDERYIEPEDRQLVRILMKANEQAANEAKKNPDRKVTKLK